MPKSILLTLILPLLASFSAQGGEPHPLMNAKVGNVATYTMKSTLGFGIHGMVTYTVIAKDKNVLTIKVTGWTDFGPPQGKITHREADLKFDLAKPLNPLRFADLDRETSGKATRGKEGTEKIKVAGKEYDCRYVNYAFDAKFADKNFKTQIKLWISKDMPLGVVKSFRLGNDIDPKEKMTMELKEFKSK